MSRQQNLSSETIIVGIFGDTTGPRRPPDASPVRGKPLGSTPSRTFPGENRWLAFIIAVTGVITVGIVAGAVIPGYTAPTGRIYTSRFGYPELLRLQGRPFPVATSKAKRRALSRTFLGEGVVRSEPVLVPIVPMGRIVSVKVSDGDPVQKGQLIAEIDPGLAVINLEAARSAVKIAQAELERTKIGSNYILRFERPKMEAILLDISKQQLDLQNQLLALLGKFNRMGFAASFQVIETKLAQLATELQMRDAEVTLDMAQKGLEQSKQIAAETIRTAELALELRRVEEKEYKVYSPVDGTVERCLVHEGEYNPAIGNPAFLLTTGSWFEAQFDQITYGEFRVADRAEVHLEASQGRVFNGQIVKIHPYVSYNLGGPETTRPIRPLGTGAPEWPATYAVCIRIDDSSTTGKNSVVPGQTGFARVSLVAESLAVNRAAVISVSAGKGMVYVVDGDRFRPKEVSLGITDGDWREILAGLSPDEEVIVDGHFALMPDDRVIVTRRERGGE